jgi:hypothetical protein
MPRGPAKPKARSKTELADAFANELAAFVALSAVRLSTSPHSPVGDDEMEAFRKMRQLFREAIQ